MKLDTNTINKIAKLARIRLSEEEAKDLLKDMNSILDWVEQLNEVNTDAVEPKGIVNTGNITNDFTSPNDIWVWLKAGMNILVKLLKWNNLRI